MDSGAVKGLRKDQPGEHLLHVLLLHFGCGRLLLETALRARWAELADPSAVGLWKWPKNCKVLAAYSSRGGVPGAKRKAGAVCVLRSQLGAPQRPGRARAPRPSREPPVGCLTRHPEMVAEVEEPR